MHWIICPVVAQNTGHLSTKPKVSGLLISSLRAARGLRLRLLGNKSYKDKRALVSLTGLTSLECGQRLYRNLELRAATGSSYLIRFAVSTPEQTKRYL
jgi:hypothetical protein